MKKFLIKTAGAPKEIRAGLKEIIKDRSKRFSNKTGTSLKLKQDSDRKEDGHTITIEKGTVVITYRRTIDAFRGIGKLLGQKELPQKKKVISEDGKFKTLGIMIDASRNGVATVDTLKAILRKLSLMGMNVLMMYCEDTYEVPGEPFFGYLRGAYTIKEMKELDDYAFNLGIEMFPCIQTLAHMEQVLQWPAYSEYKDLDHILLPEDKKVYTLIEKMMAAATAPFRSNRIHIGMDEAWNLGQGKYKELHGEPRPFDIMNKHLTKVRNICKKLKINPIIWSDMYFRLGSENHGYYDEVWNIPKDVVKDIPKDVQLVYWDYYHKDYDTYAKMIDRHRSLGSEPIVAPGVWTWTHFWAALHFAKNTLTPCMTACRDKGIKEILLTAWGDNGMEVDLFSMLPGCQYYAEFGYAEKVNEQTVKDNFKGSCDGDYDAWFEASYIDYPPDIKKPEVEYTNTSKFLLYGDVLLGLWDPQIKQERAKKFYTKLAASIAEKSKTQGNKRLRFPAQIAKVISIKLGLRDRLVAAYKKNDKRAMRKLLKNDITDLAKETKKLWKMHRDLWLDTYKPFGLEVIEMRHGSCVARAQSLVERITKYLSGEIKSIPELETKLHKVYHPEPGKVPLIGSYTRIVSPSRIV